MWIESSAPLLKVLWNKTTLLPHPTPQISRVPPRGGALCLATQGPTSANVLRVWGPVFRCSIGHTWIYSRINPQTYETIEGMWSCVMHDWPSSGVKAMIDTRQLEQWGIQHKQKFKLTNQLLSSDIFSVMDGCELIRL